MGYEKNYLLLLAGILVLFFVLETAQLSGMVEVDFGLLVPVAMMLFGLIGGIVYARTGDLNLFFIAACLILIGVIAYFDAFSLMNTEIASMLGFAIIIALVVLRLVRKAAEPKKEKAETASSEESK